MYDDEMPETVYLGEMPYWMVRQLLGNARHSKYTSRSEHGKEDAQKIISYLEYAIEESWDDDQNERDGTIGDSIEMRFRLTDPTLSCGDFNAKVMHTRDELSMSEESPERLLETSATQYARALVESWSKHREDEE